MRPERRRRAAFSLWHELTALSLSAFKTIRLFFPAERDFRTSIQPTNTEVGRQPPVSSSARRPLCSLTECVFWIGPGKDGTYQQALSSNTGQACSVKEALVKLDSRGCLTPVFHLLPCTTVDALICVAHSRGREVWGADHFSHHLSLQMLYVSVRWCACVWVIVWSPHSLS